MPALNFKIQFVPHIRSGRKTHTIRSTRKLPIKTGDTLYLYTGMRTRHCQKIIQSVCLKVEDVLIRQRKTFSNDSTERFEVAINGVGLESDEKQALAYADGFKSFSDMMIFWQGRLPFIGHIIHWERRD